MASTQYSSNEKGEKVIAASLRPDGTVRKERRVRAGYVPQDEVPIYVPRHVRERRAAEAGQGLSSSSIPGYTGTPSRHASRRPEPSASAHARISSAGSSRSEAGSVDDAVAALNKLNITEPAIGQVRAVSSKPKEERKEASATPRRRGGGSFKFSGSSVEENEGSRDRSDTQEINTNRQCGDANSSGSNGNAEKVPSAADGKAPAGGPVVEELKASKAAPKPAAPAASRKPPGLPDPWEEE